MTNDTETLSPAYEAALVASNTATTIWMRAQAAYRSMKIGDAEFLAAKAAHDVAQAAFDVAFAAEQAQA